MTIYHVYDHDPMASSMGADYLASTHRTLKAAEAEAERLNAEHRAYFVRNACNGRSRAVTEPWCWRHARVEKSRLK